MKPQAVGFDFNSARQIVRATRAYNREPRGTVAAPSPTRLRTPVKYAIVQQEIGKRNGTVLGKGTISLQVLSVGSSGDASYNDLGVVVPCYSGAAAPIAAGRLIIVEFIDGYYQVLTDFCDAN